MSGVQSELGDGAIADWLVIAKPNPHAKVRLLCFPSAGSGAAMFARWPDLLPRFIEVAAVQLPGRERRRHEPPLRSAAAVLRPLLDAADRIFRKPCALFGHSIGGLLAHLFSQELAASGTYRPLHLFLSACMPPRRYSYDGVPKHLWPDDKLLAFLSDMEGGGAAPSRISSLQRRLLPLLRADIELGHQTARTTSPLQGNLPISVYGGTSDLLVNSADLEAWQGETCAACTVKLFPGGHSYLRSHLESVLADIVATLHAADSAPGVLPKRTD